MNEYLYLQTITRERERERDSSPYNLFGEKQISLDYLHNNI